MCRCSRNRRFSGGSLAITAGFLTLFGFIFVITQYFQFIKAYSAFETGVRLLPVAVSIAVASVVGPRIVERIGTTAVVVRGPGDLRRRPGVGVHRRRQHSVPGDRDADGAARRRPGPDDGARPPSRSWDRSAPIRPASVRRQRHHPRTRRHARRRDRRQRVRLHLFRPAGLRSGDHGAARARPAPTMERSMAAAQQVIAQLPPAADAGYPGRRRNRLPRRPSDRIAGLRGHRAGCGGRRRRDCCPRGHANLALHRNRNRADRTETRSPHELHRDVEPTATGRSSSSPDPTDRACATSPRAPAPRWC